MQTSTNDLKNWSFGSKLKMKQCCVVHRIPNERVTTTMWELLCKNSAYWGHLECLKRAHELGCPWDKYVYDVAVEGNHVECIHYLENNNCPKE